MKVLGIDSSGLVAGVALVEDDKLTAEFTVNDKKTHSQTLLPMLEQIRELTGLELQTVDVVAVAAGPGSFTGLRIGSATAKGLGMALGKPLAAVPTVDGLAYNLWGNEALICPLMDARRNQVYTGIYTFLPAVGEAPEKTPEGAAAGTEPGGAESRRELLRQASSVLHGPDYEFVTLEAQSAAELDCIAGKVNQWAQRTGKPVIFLGDGVQVYAERLAGLMRVPYSFAPAHVNKQRASAVAALGLLYAKEGRLQTAEEHAPVYLRLSQAERERMEQLKQMD